MLSLFLRVLLLAALLVCALVRLNAFSLFYLLCFFAFTPFLWELAAPATARPRQQPGLASPTARWSLHDGPDDTKTAAHHSPFIFASPASRALADAAFRRVLLFVLAASLAILLAIAAFHIAGAASSVDDTGTWYVAIGLQPQSPSSTGNTALLFVPDLVVFLVAAALLVTLALAQKAADAPPRPSPAHATNGQAPVPLADGAPHRFSFHSLRSLDTTLPQTSTPEAWAAPVEPRVESRRWVWVLLDTHYSVLHFVAFALLLFVGIVDLSILSLVYYCAWIAILCLWACTRPDPSLGVPTLSRSPSQSLLEDRVDSLVRPAPLEEGESASSISAAPLHRPSLLTDGSGLSRSSLSGFGAAGGSLPLTRHPSALLLEPIPDVDEKAEEETTGDRTEDVRGFVIHDEDEDGEDAKEDPHSLITRTDSFFHSPRHGRPPPPTEVASASSVAEVASATDPWYSSTSTVFTVGRLHRFYRLLSLYLTADFLVRYVYRLLYHYDAGNASLEHVGFYTGVDGTSASVGLGAEYALILVLYLWVQTLVQFHERYLCLPALLFPSLRARNRPRGSNSDSPVGATSPISTASATPSMSTNRSASPPSSPLAAALQSYTPPMVYYKLSRFVIAYSFILVPVVTFCLALYYDILPAVIFLGVMALSLLLPSPLSLLLAPLTLLLMTVFNVALYSLYLPSPYWSLSSFSVVDHPWWEKSVFALLVVSSAAMLYVGFVVKYKVMAFASWWDLLVWRDVDRERREDEREMRQKAAKEKRLRKRQQAREEAHQRALREAQALQEEEDWETEWARLTSEALHPGDSPRRRRRSRPRTSGLPTRRRWGG